MTELSDLGSMASVLRELASAPVELLIRGTVVDDQFAIERAIGHGAMGVVYLARDNRLDRNVAIKIARGASPQLLAQTSREAMLLAKLAHPNVVVIHQIGTLGGRVYVAMEYVAGATARGWCEGKSAAAILALYAAVGDGLAAAHAAGLVHRDFKPDNVLVGEDGRGRVADFGLAREAHDGPDERAGTPRYMAPEQLAGGEVDARADQYAFCQSVSEAIGERRIPRHVAAALARGTNKDRNARWPSMQPLLAVLRKRPVGPMPVAAATGAVLAIGVGLFAMSRHHEVDPCAAAGRELDALWPDARVQGRGFAELDEYANRWRTASRTACVAAWSPALHDRGTECLAREQHQLASAIGVLADPALEASKREDVLVELERPEACTDPSYLVQLVPPPTDPALAVKVAAANQQLDRVNQLRSAGRGKEAEALLATVDPLGFAPLAARVHALHAMAQQESDDHDGTAKALVDAYFEARGIGDRDLSTQAAATAALMLLDASKDADAGLWARIGEVESQGLAEPSLRAASLNALSAVANARGDAAHALLLADQAIALLRGLTGPTVIANALRARADANVALGHLTEALADLDDAIARATRQYGDDTNLEVSDLEVRRALVLNSLRRLDDAIAAAKHGLAIGMKLAPTSKYVDNAQSALGSALAHSHRFDEALALLDQSFAADVKKDGPRSYNVASDHNNRCDLLTQMKRYDVAIAECRLASELFAEVDGPRAPDVSVAQFNLARAYADADRQAEARDAAAAGIASLVGQPEVAKLGLLLIERGRAENRLHQIAQGRADLQHAVAIFTASSPNPSWLPWSQLELGILEQEDGKRAAAAVLARSAYAAFTTQGDERAVDAAHLLEQLGAR